MSYDAKILCDSIANGVRLATIQVTFPRIVLAEKNTHRALSRSSASSRAIPVVKQVARVMDDPFIPAAFAANKKGMQAGDALSDEDQQFARDEWLDARDYMVLKANRMASRDVHKQWANRLIEPFAWHTAIVTATDWANFFALRCSPMAQPEIRTAAEMMRDVMAASTPRKMIQGEWHLPLVYDFEDFGDQSNFDMNLEDWAKVSAARCARVSYLTHEGKRDVDADLALYERLATSGHWSPLEHAARPAVHDDGAALLAGLGVSAESGLVFDPAHLYYGNLKGWFSLRKTMPGEAVFVPPPVEAM